MTCAILESLDRIPKAFITFDVSPYFFSLPASTSDSRILVVFDIDSLVRNILQKLTSTHQLFLDLTKDSMKSPICQHPKILL